VRDASSSLPGFVSAVHRLPAVSRRIALLVAAIVLLAAAPAWAQRGRSPSGAEERAPREEEERERIELSLSAFYEEGKFGGEHPTYIWSFPMHVKYRGDRFDVTVETAYLRISSRESVQFVDDTESGFVAVGEENGVADDEEIVEEDEENGRRRVDERFGDVTLTLRAHLFEDPGEDSPLPALSPFISVSIPTRRGLRTDYEFGLELDKDLGPLFLYGEVSYTIIGKSRSDDLRDRVAAMLGAGVDLSRSVTLSGDVQWSTSVVPGLVDPLTATATLDWRVARSLTISPQVFIGLSRSAAAFGAGVEISYLFGRW
jgi:hypothetical protein